MSEKAFGKDSDIGKFKQPESCPVPKTAGYPSTGVKTSGIKRRGNGAQTKAKIMRGPNG